MMDLPDFAQPSAITNEPETFEGVILEDAEAGQPVRVRMPGLSNELTTDPCPWTPVVSPSGIFYPHAGDLCVVVQPAQGDPWIASWVPSTEVPDAVVTGSGDKHYTHTQSTPSSSWSITHNLGKRPSVTVVDSAGTEWVVEVQHLSDNACIAKFAHAFSGKAYCN
jgi:hypothetical protein